MLYEIKFQKNNLKMYIHKSMIKVDYLFCMILFLALKIYSSYFSEILHFLFYYSLVHIILLFLKLLLCNRHHEHRHLQLCERIRVCIRHICRT